MMLGPLLICLCVLYPAKAFKLPSYMTACSRNDPKLNECVVKNGRAAIPSFIHGDPKYGVPELDPFMIEEMKIRQGTQQVGLNLTLTKVKLYGLGHVEFTDARVDLKKNHIEWDFKSKQGIQMVGPYTVSGKVLLLPITGEGTANITLSDVKFTIKYDFNVVKKKGKDYMHVMKVDLTYDIRGAHFNLENLFNGDKLLGDNMNRFLNENWKELVSTFGSELAAALEEIFKRLFSNICSRVPYEDIFPETTS